MIYNDTDINITRYLNQLGYSFITISIDYEDNKYIDFWNIHPSIVEIKDRYYYIKNIPIKDVLIYKTIN